MKKVLIIILAIFMLTACGTKNENEPLEKANETNTNQINETTNNDNNNTNIDNSNDNNTSDNNVVFDDEIIDIEDVENGTINEEIVNVEEVINCDGCVYAYFDGENENAKSLGSTLSSDEYTTDIRTLKTMGGKQRHNFFGLVLSGNTISKAYACILKDNKIYCIEGSTNGAYHNSNIAILNKIFTSSQCKTLSDGHNYWCTDGSYNGNTKTSGYTSLHYETSCTIYGSDANTGKLICH